MARSKLQRFTIVAGAMIGGIILLVVFLGWQLAWSPIFDDGPFTGRPVAKLPTTAPTQSFPVKDFLLEVYSPPNDGEAPIVLLRDRDKKIKWAVHAEGMEKTQVTSLEFTHYRTVFDITVRGTVHWTFGHEGMMWIIGRDGALKEYWYSW